MRWLLLLLPGGLLLVAAIAIYEWRVQRRSGPTRFADTRAMVERPVIVDGKPHQPRLRKVVA